MNKTKVLLIVPRLTKGGGEKVVSELSCALANEDYEIFIAVYERKITYRYMGKIINLNFRSLSNNYILRFLQNIYRLIKIVKLKYKYNIDYSISFLVNPNILNLMSIHKSRTILTLHTHLSCLNYYKKKSTYHIDNYLVKFFYPLAFKIVCVSKSTQFDLIDNFGIKKSKTTLIYNFLELKYLQKRSIEPIPVEFDYIFSNPYFISIGRLNDTKNHSLLIESFSIFLKNNPNYNLIILGEGPLAKKLNSQINKLNICNKVFLLGFVENPYPFLKNSLALIGASLYEGLSMVYLEGRLLNKPLLSFDCPGGQREIIAPNIETDYEIKELYDAEYGILIPVLSKLKNINNLCMGLEKIINDISGDKIKVKCQSREIFDIQRHLDKWKEILK